jgi:drug/metabolite transporter (DMT)-like permease
VAIKLSLEGIPPFLGAGLRFLIAVPLLYLYLRVRGIPFLIHSRVYLLVLVTGVLIYGVDYGLVYWSEQYLSAGVTAILFATFPFFVAIFSHLVFKSESLGLNVYVGLMLGFAGVAATSYDEFFDDAPEGLVLAATCAVIVSAAAGALATVITKKHLTGIHPGSLALNQTALGSALLILVALFRGELGEATWGTNALMGLAYLAVIASALAFTLFYWLLQRMSAVTLALMIFILPIVAVICEWFVYGEIITATTVVGMVLIFLGIAIAELPKYRYQLARSLGNSSKM